MLYELPIVAIPRTVLRGGRSGLTVPLMLSEAEGVAVPLRQAPCKWQDGGLAKSISRHGLLSCGKAVETRCQLAS